MKTKKQIQEQLDSVVKKYWQCKEEESQPDYEYMGDEPESSSYLNEIFSLQWVLDLPIKAPVKEK